MDNSFNSREKLRCYLLICKKCKKRFGIEGVDYWSVKISLCSYCNEQTKKISLN